MTRTKRNYLISLLVLACAAVGILVARTLVNIHEDRQVTIRITGNVKVYDRESPAGYTRGDDGVIEILHPVDRVQVERITFHDNEGFEAIRIRLRDGRTGYIFCCENFEMSK